MRQNHERESDPEVEQEVGVKRRTVRAGIDRQVPAIRCNQAADEGENGHISG